MHQICSNDFISRTWIDAFYIPDSSYCDAIDFRTTANAQFKVLETLCKLAHGNIFDALFNLNNTQLLTANVLPENTMFIRTKISSERIRIDTLIQFNNALKLIQLTTHSSCISTALNTNYVLGAVLRGNGSSYAWFTSFTSWRWTLNNQTTTCRCEQDTCSFLFFFDLADFIPDFVGSCALLQAVLKATFICFYHKECITKLVEYFPRLTQLIPTINTLNTLVSSKYPLLRK